MATQKQKRLVRVIAENVGKNGNGKPMGELMLSAGYSPDSSKHPARITRTQAFQKLLTRAGITDSKLSRKLREGLDADDPQGHNDYGTRHRYLMTALELKGLITRKGFNIHVGTKNTQINAPIMIIRAPGRETGEKEATI